MPEQLNPELQEALQEAGADAKSSRVAARSVASAIDMAKVVIWLRSLTATMGVLVAINVVALNQLFVLTAEVAENRASIVALTDRVGNLEDGQREILDRLQEIRLSKNTFGESNGGAPEVSAAPVVAVPVSPPSPPSPNPPSQ